MAVITLYQSDYDLSKTFTDKKDADVYDKMLELAQNVGTWMKHNVPDLTDDQIASLGSLVAENKADLIKALKGKSEILLQATESDESTPDSQDAPAPAASEA